MYIGIRHDYEDTQIITDVELFDWILEKSIYTIENYCDFRYSTDITRFIYDPFSGEKINWKKVKQDYHVYRGIKTA